MKKLIELPLISSFQDNALTQPPEDKAHGSVTMMTYVRYFMAGGGYFLLLFVMVVFVLGEVNTRGYGLYRPLGASMQMVYSDHSPTSSN